MTSRTRGILNPALGLARFELSRRQPSPALAALADWCWIVRWSLDDAHEQEVLPHPCVNIVIEAHEAAVHGIGTRRDVRRLTGTGRVVAVKLKPGGFYPFARVPMRSLVDRAIPLAEAFGAAGAALADAVRAEEDDARAALRMDDFFAAELASRAPDPGLAEAMALAIRAGDDREIKTAEDLARLAGTSVRTLHRAFERYIGVGPKWIIRRSRVQEAAERVAAGAAVPWSDLAQELGYHDQAHLIRDFKAQVGFTPAVYAERCAAATKAPVTAPPRTPDRNPAAKVAPPGRARSPRGAAARSPRGTA
jgi:AraC-like DNA-binding protein